MKLAAAALERSLLIGSPIIIDYQVIEEVVKLAKCSLLLSLSNEHCS